MLRSIAELAAYGTLAAVLTAASLLPANAASSAAIGNTAADGRVRSVTSERGALLFATKGCVGCHMHVAFPNARMQVGPDLTGSPTTPRRASPASMPARTYGSPFKSLARIACPVSTRP